MAEFPKEQILKIRAELDNAVVVRPGDKLVYATPNRLSQHQAATVKEMLAERLPGVEIVIASECSGLAVYRDEQPDNKAIEQWIRANPQEFERWVRKQTRIRGAMMGNG